MGKLIDATRLVENIEWAARHGTSSMIEIAPFILKLIELAPDAQKKGYWINHSYKNEESYDDMWVYNECSNCHCHCTIVDNYAYCPYCGCKMKTN